MNQLIFDQFLLFFQLDLQQNLFNIHDASKFQGIKY